jgi:hypothetical protein
MEISASIAAPNLFAPPWRLRFIKSISQKPDIRANSNTHQRAAISNWIVAKNTILIRAQVTTESQIFINQPLILVIYAVYKN